MRVWTAVAVFVLCLATGGLSCSRGNESALTVGQENFVDAAVTSIMQRDDIPGVSLAIVLEGRIVYRRSYGYANIPHIRTTTRTRFAIGSITKQLTAAAILLLAQRGRLSLDDPVGKYLPDINQAQNVTIREVLGHTSGYVDYLSQEFLPDSVQMPTTVGAILGRWGKLPLSFPAGSRWEYSGTNYVIAARIVEIASGTSYEDFMRRNILVPLGIFDGVFVDESPSSALDATGYYRFGLGPPRVAPRAGKYWLFGMADLGMTSADVARWDCAMIGRQLLNSQSWSTMLKQGTTTSGNPTGYGLGVFVSTIMGADGKPHVMVSHPGEISGFRSDNWVVPDLKSGLVVLTNAEYSSGAQDIGVALQGLIGVVDRPPTVTESPLETRVRKMLELLARGKVDRSELASDASAFFTSQALDDIRYGLAGMGSLRQVSLVGTQYRASLTHYTFAVTYELATLQVDEYLLPSGKIEEFFLDKAR